MKSGSEGGVRVKWWWWGVLLVVTVMGLGYGFRRVLLEEGLRWVLAERGVEVEALPVEEAGWSGQTLGRSRLGWRGQSVGWDGLAVRWGAGGMFSDEAERLELAGPWIELDTGILRQELAAMRAMEEAVLAEEEVEERVEAGEEVFEEGVTEELPEPETLERDLLDVIHLPIQLGLDPVVLVENMGVETVRMGEGRLVVEDWDWLLGEMKWDLLMGRGDGDWEGTMSLEGAMMGGEGGGRVERNSGEFSAHINGEVEAVLLEALLERVGGGQWLESGRLAGSLEGGLLVEGVDTAVHGLSGEMRLGGLEWSGNGKQAYGVELGNAVVAFGLTGEDFLVDAGAEVEAVRWGEWVSEPFGMHVALRDGKSLELESERIEVAGGNWEGGLALRGHFEPLGATGRGRLECSVADWRGHGIGLEPFSVLVEGGRERVQIRSSPVGLVRAGTLWVEEAGGEVWPELSLSALVYGLSGEALGEFRIAGDGAGAWLLEWANGDGEPLGSLTYEEAGEAEEERYEAEGQVPYHWLGTALEWWGDWPVKVLSGAVDFVGEMELGRGRLPRGEGRLALEDLELEWDGETTLQGLAGEVEVYLRGLPRTVGEPEIRVEAITGWPVEVKNLQLRWEAPTMRHVRVLGGQVEVADAMVELVPFEMDPLDPVVATEVRIEGLAANQLLELLGEERFAVEGKLAGAVEIGYAAGMVRLGPGELRLSGEGEAGMREAGRFLFKDEGYLREQLERMGGFPESVRVKLLNTLLRNGIDLRELQVELEGEPGEEMVLLRITVRGEARSEEMEVPIEGFILNNRVPLADLQRVLGMEGRLRVGRRGEDLP